MSRYRYTFGRSSDWLTGKAKAGGNYQLELYQALQRGPLGPLLYIHDEYGNLEFVLSDHDALLLLLCRTINKTYKIWPDKKFKDEFASRTIAQLLADLLHDLPYDGQFTEAEEYCENRIIEHARKQAKDAKTCQPKSAQSGITSGS